jgi:two-component system NtrC family sensor kinase
MPQNSEWRILVIDDEQDICDVVTLALTDSGYAVATALDGEAGLARFREFEPHIVITDIRMPRLDGLQVLERIKAATPNVEVIVVTAFGEMELAIRALQLDASDFITKPLGNDALLVALKRAKQRHTTRRQLQEYTRFLEDGWIETTQELLDTYAYQQKLIESSMDGILGVDARETVVTHNQSMERMFGHTGAEARHHLCLVDFFDSAALLEFRTALNSDAYGGRDRLYLYETRMRTREGASLPVQLSAVTLLEQGKPVGMVCFIRDLRQIRKLEQQMADQARILHQDKMMSLGRLAASVAHEINNPLSGVLNYVRLMIRIAARQAITVEQQTKFQDYLNVVEKEVDRCSRIVGNLLTFARKSPASRQAVSMGEMIERCVMLSRHRLELGNIELETHIPPDLPTVRGDANQLQQCVMNLILNAVDAMPGGGRLKVSACARPQTDCVQITIGDTGGGIAPDDLPHIFEPFFTTKKEGYGTGLGLSTTYGIVEEHNGTITVQSKPNNGTTFTVELPVEG